MSASLEFFKNLPGLEGSISPEDQQQALRITTIRSLDYFLTTELARPDNTPAIMHRIGGWSQAKDRSLQETFEAVVTLASTDETLKKAIIESLAELLQNSHLSEASITRAVEVCLALDPTLEVTIPTFASAVTQRYNSCLAETQGLVKNQRETEQSIEHFHKFLGKYYHYLFSQTEDSESLYSAFETYVATFYPQERTAGLDFGKLKLSSRLQLLLGILIDAPSQDAEKVGELFPWDALHNLDVKPLGDAEHYHGNLIRLLALAPEAWSTEPENHAMVAEVLHNQLGYPVSADGIGGAHSVKHLALVYERFVGNTFDWQDITLASAHATRALVSYANSSTDSRITEYELAQTAFEPLFTLLQQVDWSQLPPEALSVKLKPLLQQMLHLHQRHQVLVSTYKGDDEVPHTGLDQLSAVLLAAPRSLVFETIVAEQEPIVALRFLQTAHPEFLSQRNSETPAKRYWQELHEVFLNKFGLRKRENIRAFRQYILDTIYDKNSVAMIKDSVYSNSLSDQLEEITEWNYWYTADVATALSELWIERTSLKILDLRQDLIQLINRPELQTVTIEYVISQMTAYCEEAQWFTSKMDRKSAPMHFCEQQIVACLNSFKPDTTPVSMQISRQLTKLLKYLSPEQWQKVQPFTQRQLLLSLEKTVSPSVEALQATFIEKAVIGEVVDLCILGALKDFDVLKTLIERKDLILFLNHSPLTSARFLSIIESFVRQCSIERAVSANQTHLAKMLVSKASIRRLLEQNQPETLEKLDLIVNKTSQS